MPSSGETNHSSTSPGQCGYAGTEPSSSSPMKAETRSGFDPDSVRSSVFNGSDGTVTPRRPRRHPRAPLPSPLRPIVPGSQYAIYQGNGLMDDPDDVSVESDFEEDEEGIPEGFLGGFQLGTVAANEQDGGDEDGDDEGDDTEMPEAPVEEGGGDEEDSSDENESSDEEDDAIGSDGETFPANSTSKPAPGKRGREPMSSPSQGPSAKRGRK